mgnify:CR=1 FL=1
MPRGTPPAYDRPMPIRVPPDASPRERLVLLLLDLFDPGELRRTVHEFDDRHRTSIHDDLPAPANPARVVAAGLVAALSDPQIHAFLELASAERPRRSKEIAELRALFPESPPG